MDVEYQAKLPPSELSFNCEEATFLTTILKFVEDGDMQWTNHRRRSVWTCSLIPRILAAKRGVAYLSYRAPG